MIGITATRQPVSTIQAAMLGARLERAQTLGATELVHGDCVGGDALAHSIAMLLGYVVHVRPPSNERYRAFAVGHHNYEPAEYMTRNRLIVGHCTELIALPMHLESADESRRSGTWATVRMARRLARPITLVWPDGRVEPDRGADDTQGDGHGGGHKPAGLEGVGPGTGTQARRGDSE